MLWSISNDNWSTILHRLGPCIGLYACCDELFPTGPSRDPQWWCLIQDLGPMRVPPVVNSKTKRGPCENALHVRTLRDTEEFCSIRLFDLTHPPNPCMKCTMKLQIDHHTGNYVPYSFRQVCGFFKVPC